MYHQIKIPAPLALALVWAIAANPLPTSAQENLLTNGDFEDLTDWGAVGDPPENAPLGWRDSPSGRLNAAGQQTGSNAIGGAGTSAFLPADVGVATADRKDFAQIREEMTGPVYRFSFDIATEDPGEAGDRSLSMSTRDDTNNGLTVSFRINGDGDLQSYTGSWGTILTGAFIFDDDVTTTPLVHHVEFTVNTTNTPFYDLQVIDSNDVVHSIAGVTDFRGVPSQGAGATGIEFNTFLSSGNYLLDNVSLVNVPPDLLFTIDRETGSVTLTNNADPLAIAGYTLSSTVGGLDAGNWKSIAENYDNDGPNTADGGALIGSVDPNGAWNKLGTPNSQELSEAALLSQGATLATEQTVDLGTGTWVRSPFEDVEVEVLLADGTVATAAVEFVGNDNTSYTVGDFDLDGDVDLDDFNNGFVPHYFANTSGSSFVDQYFLGDLDSDGKTGFQDFLLFNEAYIAANPNAPELSLNLAVPEPITATLVLLASTVCLCTRLRRFNWRPALICGSVAALSVLMLPDARAQSIANGDFEDTTGWLFAGAGPGTQPAGWRDTTGDNPATQQFDSLAIGGSGVSARMQQVAGGRIRQNLETATKPQFEFSFDFASADPGGAANRSLSASIFDQNLGAVITMRVVDEEDDGIGELEFYSGSWEVGTLPDSVIFSNLDSDPLTHSVSIYVDTTREIPSYDVVLTDSNGVSHEAMDLPYFNGGVNPFDRAGAVEFPTVLSDGEFLLDNVQISNRISSDRLGLRVVNGTGEVFLTNLGDEPVALDGYRIASESGALEPDDSNWSSLEDQAIDGSPGNPVWRELGGISSELAEGYVGGNGTLLAPSASISLGTAYNTSGTSQDLAFEYHIAGTPAVSLLGPVNYVDVSAGDYNADGVVDGRDFLVWQYGGSPSPLSMQDLADWETNFGTGIATTATTGAVPEPHALTLLALAAVAFFGRSGIPRK